MTTPNVELVRSFYRRWARGDFSSTEGLHPDFELVLADGPTPGSWRGAAAGAAWGELISAWNGFRVEAEECRAVDRERVLVLTKNTGRGRSSGLELGDMQTRGANVFHLSGGLVTRLILYFNRDQALADLATDG